MASRPGAFKYDVAVSYAGEDRRVVGRIVKSLQSQGLSVFFDRNSMSTLWGKGQSEFERIYARESRYVMPVMSEHYVKKDWCRLEFEVAREESRRRQGEFILPARLDSTRILGLHEDTIYMDLKRTTPAQVAKAVAEKCAMQRPGNTEPVRGSQPGRAARVLPFSEQQVLGIVAFSTLPVPEKSYRAMFPRYAWGSAVARLRSLGLICEQYGGLHVPKNVSSEFFKNPADRKHFAKAWADATEPHKDHVDTALMFATSCFPLRRLDDAVLALANVANYQSLGWWNRLYVSALTAIANGPVVRALRPESLVRLYNALGTCLVADGKYEESLPWYARLEKHSKAIRHAWGLGQAYINAGYVNANLGRMQEAEKLYRKAIAHARRSKDYLVLGRAMSNLGQTVDDIQEAEALLKKSLRPKQVAGDDASLVNSYIGLGNVAARRGHYAWARMWFAKGMGISRRLGLRHETSLLLHNIGSAWCDDKQYRKAMLYYRWAQRIAVEDELPDVRELTLGGMGRALFETKQYREAETCYRQLYSLQSRRDVNAGSMVVWHDVGACLFQQGRMSAACQVLRDAAGLAQKLGDEEWLTRCLIDSAWTFRRGADVGRVAGSLRQDAASQERRGSAQCAARLWDHHASVVARSAPDIAERSLLRALRCLPKSRQAGTERTALYSHLYSISWQRGNQRVGLSALRAMAKIARRIGGTEDEHRAVDQMGVSLQQIGRLKEAEKAHREALQIARRLEDKGFMQGTLNNLGELLRKTGHFVEAAKMLRRSEKLAEQRGDRKWAIAAKCNRGMAIDSAGDRAGARRLLAECRLRARALGLWHEYLVASEAMGNMLWFAGRRPEAGRMYARALRDAKKHHDFEIQPGLALNLARVMKDAGQSKAALKVLRPYEKVSSALPFRYDFCVTLADLYAETGRLQSAVRMWELARKAAEANRDRDGIAYTSAAISELLERQKLLKLSDGELLRAIRNEHEPEGRARLLVQRFGLLLRDKKEKAAKAVFEEARRLTQELKLKALYVDLHMMYGDYNWKGKYAEMVNAMKAYVVASIEGFWISPEVYGNIAGHVIGKLFAARRRLRVGQLDAMERRVTDWLVHDAKANDAIVKFGTSPIRVARQFSALVDGPGLSKKEVNRVVADELALWRSHA